MNKKDLILIIVQLFLATSGSILSYFVIADVLIWEHFPVLSTLIFAVASFAGIIVVRIVNKQSLWFIRRSKSRAHQISITSSVKSYKVEQSKYELQRSNKIGIAQLIIGAILLFASVITYSTIVAFIGLGLTFWGSIFLLASSTKLVISPIVDATALSYYTNLDRIINNLNYKGNPIYIPPYPKDIYLPEHLAGLKEMVIFISANNSTIIPPIEEIAEKQFLLKNNNGICISPPGSGLVGLFEKELSINFTKIDKESFYEGLPTVIVNNLELASSFEINLENELYHVKMTDPLYFDLYSKKQNLKSIHSIGCPLTSAIASVLAIITGKTVTITKNKISSIQKKIEIWYQIIEG